MQQDSNLRNLIIAMVAIAGVMLVSQLFIWGPEQKARDAAIEAEQARIAAEAAEQERIAAEEAEQERIAAEEAEQPSLLR